MTKRSSLWLILIGALKLLKAGLLIAAGAGAFSLLHKDAKATLEAWIKALRVDPQNRFLRGLLAKASGIDVKELEAIGLGSFAYAAIFLVEGVGLILAKRWAEYLTLVATMSFIPFEGYELARRPSWIKVLAVLLNLAVVVYLWIRVRRERGDERQECPY